MAKISVKHSMNLFKGGCGMKIKNTSLSMSLTDICLRWHCSNVPRTKGYVPSARSPSIITASNLDFRKNYYWTVRPINQYILQNDTCNSWLLFNIMHNLKYKYFYVTFVSAVWATYICATFMSYSLFCYCKMCMRMYFVMLQLLTFSLAF